MEQAYQMGVKCDRESFETLSNPLKWIFIQGFLETHGKIDKDRLRVELITDDKLLLDAIVELAQIPFHFEQNKLIYQDTNTIDFLGFVYSGKSVVGKFYNEFQHLLSGTVTLEKCLVYRTCDDAILPTKSRLSDVGYDLTIIKKVKSLGSTVSLYDTGLKIRVPHGYYTEIVPRSSLSKSGYMMANSIGIIDRSYNGNLYVALAKIDPYAPEIQLPFRCCQLIFRKQYHLDIEETTTDLEATARGEGGFGSTG